MASVQEWIQSCGPFEQSTATSAGPVVVPILRSQHMEHQHSLSPHQQYPSYVTQPTTTTTAGEIIPILASVSTDHPSSSQIDACEVVFQPKYEHSPHPQPQPQQQQAETAFWYTLDPSSPNSSVNQHRLLDSWSTSSTPAAIEGDTASSWEFTETATTKDSPSLDHQQQSTRQQYPHNQQPSTSSYQQQEGAGGLDHLSALISNPWTQYYNTIVSPSLSASSTTTSVSTSSCAASSCSPLLIPYTVSATATASPSPSIVYAEMASLASSPYAPSRILDHHHHHAQDSYVDYGYPIQQYHHHSTIPSLSYTHATSSSSVMQDTTSAMHKVTPRTPSILTRRRSSSMRAISHMSGGSRSNHISSASSLSHARPSVSSTTSASSSSSINTPSSSSLTCQVCKKRYANNSTLRRHLKIHAYANSSARSMSMPRPMTGDGPSTTTHRLSLSTISGEMCASGSSTLAPYGSSSSSSASATMMSIPIQGCNPSLDPDIKKPECVGCNKAFARRDTVILHIKNKKRKWDLLNAMLPALTSPSSSLATSVINIAGDTTATTTCPTGRRVQRQRKSHPYRMVEKLWQSTLQKKGLLLTSGPCSFPSSSLTSSLRASCRDGSYGGMSVVEVIKMEAVSARPVAVGFDEKGEEYRHHHHHHQDGEGMLDLEQGEDEDGWPSLETMSRMDNQTKLRWMMKMMVVPPCWTERKVRLFGAFGVMEEKVLQ
ncbi:hypothetical protein BGZ83_005490 [Gryganskiella cystojenkinii]|nr:hypothetical protein BGZ83_005490 [Gryganskiella cystojenkinii]